ncbi:MAG: exodeoxyribonuclease V subunit gamma [bacterium]|nr:exodeoxyribonuclease V subunit gamma [bacterium]
MNLYLKTMPLILYRSNQIEALRDALVKNLSKPLEDPFEPEWLVTQNPGMTKWLTLQLSEAFGVWAHAQWYFPKRLIERVFWLVLGPVAKGLNHWSRESMSLALLSLFDELPDEERYAPLQAYLHRRPGRDSALELAQKVAYLFDQYLVYRPDWIRQFSQGKGPVLDQPDAPWQAGLWAQLERRISAAHMVELTDQFLLALKQGRSQHPLPKRISAFGLATLPESFLRLFDGLSEVCEFSFYMLSPTPDFWADLVSPRQALLKEIEADLKLQSFEELYYAQNNPLLAFLGRMGQEFQTLIEEELPHYQTGGDPFKLAPPTSLLTRLQSDLYHLNPPRKQAEEIGADQSLEIFLCPSALREMETAKNRILAALQEDPELELRDVLVLISDLETYAPLIPQVFEREPKLAYSLADQPLETQSPLIAALLGLLRSPQNRWGRSEVLDWLRIESVQRRFKLEPDAAEWAEALFSRAGVRWGRDGTHRASLAQPSLEQNTWAFGLKRVLLGYVMSPQGLFEGSAPLAGVEGKDFEQLGPLLDFLDGFSKLLNQLQGEKTLAQWNEILLEAEQGLFQSDQADWESLEFRQLIEGLTRLESHPVTVDRRGLALLVGELIGQQDSGRGFLTHGVSLSGMRPMRSIPFKLVVMVGLGEGQFPGNNQPTSFDLSAKWPRLGDRSKREDDKYLFLEALLAVRERLVLCYPARNVKDASKLPPSVVLSELMDYLDRRYLIQGIPAAQACCFEVPLLPFDGRNFDESQPQLANRHPMDRRTAELNPDLGHPYAFYQGPVEPQEKEVFALKDLLAFFRNPQEAYLTQGLGLRLVSVGTSAGQREPLSLDYLEQYQLRQILLDGLASGLSADYLHRQLSAEGLLPIGQSGEALFEDLYAETAPQAARFLTLLPQGRGRPGMGQLSLAQGRLSGEVIREDRGQLSSGGANGRRLLGWWIEHLFANALWGPRPSLMVPRQESGQPPAWKLLPTPQASKLLSDLLCIYQRGLIQPLPFFPKEGFLLVAKPAAEGEDPFKPALGPWNQKVDYATKNLESYQRIWGGRDLLYDEACAKERQEFLSLSAQIFRPLIDHLQEVL